MVINPFDRNFFKFFIGFICMLTMSFAVLYVVGRYTDPNNKQTASKPAAAKTTIRK